MGRWDEELRALARVGTHATGNQYDAGHAPWDTRAWSAASTVSLLGMAARRLDLPRLFDGTTFWLPLWLSNFLQGAAGVATPAQGRHWDVALAWVERATAADLTTARTLWALGGYGAAVEFGVALRSRDGGDASSQRKHADGAD